MNLEDFYLWTGADSRGDAAGGRDPDPPPEQPDVAGPLEDDLETERRELEKLKQDRSHFDYFYGKYYSRIFSFAFHATGDQDTATDLAQETFARALEQIHRFEWRGISVGAWLYRIAGNLLARKMRQWGRRAETPYLEGLHAPHDTRTPDRIVGHARDLELIQACMRRLPWPQQEAMILQHWEGLSASQIADATDTPLGTVHSHLKRGRERLTHHLTGPRIWPLLTETAQRRIREAQKKDRQMRLVDEEESRNEERNGPKGGE